MLAFLPILLLCLAGLGEAASRGKTAKLPYGTYVSVHNRQRKHFGAKALRYAGDKLQRDTQKWANQCVFKHSKGPYGENIYVIGSWPKAPTVNFYKDAMRSWMSEAKTYFGGGKGDTGHFTQVVWKGTTSVACAVSSCPAGTIYSNMASKFYVCRYQKPGNYYGEYKKNVGRYRRA